MNTTIIVPTFDEAANAVALIERIDAAMRGRAAEILFVDDGTDELPGVVEAFAPTVTIPVRVIRRIEPLGGLGGAVVEGIRNSDSDLVVVCDGDLQHPPELIPGMIDEAEHAELVVASRYVAGGNAGGLANGARRLVSRVTGSLSKATFPQRLKRCTDPMSGFFAVRRAAVAVDQLRPRGFKILLEIMARSQPMSVVEVPFVFGQRVAGESHAGMSEGLRFIRQLIALRLSVSSTVGRATLFMLVGMSGVLPNLGVLRALVHLHVDYLVAAVIAIQVSIVWNFVGAEVLVWRGKTSSRSAARRFVQFAAVGETDLLRLPFVYLLVDFVRVGSTLATLITIAAAFMLRFTLADKIVYRTRPGVIGLPAPVEPTTQQAA